MKFAHRQWRLFGITLGFLCAVSTAPGLAALIEADHPTFGTSSLTIDTDSNLAWLDLTFTIGLSFVDAISQTGPGGQFEGFRAATDIEALGLFQAAGIPHIDASEFDFSKAAENIGPAEALILLIGQTSSQDGHPEAFGFLETIPPSIPGARVKAELDFFFGNDIPGYLVGPYGGAFNENFGLTNSGTFLVQSIPEPSALSLGAMATVGMLMRRRRPTLCFAA